MPGEAPFSVLVEAGQPWGDTRINRKLDARWRGLARGVLDSVTATTVAYLQFAAIAVDTEGLSIGGADGTRRVYEFSTAVAPVLSYGDVVVGTNGLATATLVAGALQVAIHNDPLGPMRANLIQAGADTLMFTSRDALNYGDLGALNYEIVTNSAGGAPGAWGTPPTALRNVANSVIAGSGVTPAAYQECHGSYGVTAADATIAAVVGEGLAVACVRFNPTFGQYVVLTAAGIPRSLDAISFNWVQVDDSGKFALMVFDTGPTLANTDTIHWSASIY